MIFARINLPEFDGASLSSLLHRASPKLLQVDAPPEWHLRMGATETTGWRQLARALPIVYPQIYLRPDLCVVSNAGYPDVIESMTLLAEFLVSRGSRDILISAIRGDNLSPDIQAVVPIGYIPKHSKVLSARVEVGGGPFATAFAEGARFVLSGSYDVSAPLIGAAVERGACSWQDGARLGRLAAASHFEGVKVEVEPDGSVELETSATRGLSRVRALGLVVHADVTADFHELALVPTNRQTLRPVQITTESSRCLWMAHIAIESGFQASAIVSGSMKMVRGFVDGMPADLTNHPLTVTEFFAAIPEEGRDDAIVRIEYRGPNCEVCQEFVDWLQFVLMRNPSAGRLLAPRPAVEQATEVISVQIPADAVTISVDTRPAHEWM